MNSFWLVIQERDRVIGVLTNPGCFARLVGRVKNDIRILFEMWKRDESLCFWIVLFVW